MNIAVVSATRDEPKGFQMPSLTMAERAFSCPIKPFPIWNNTKGLPEVYNDFLNNHQAVDKHKDFDCVLFIHDDLEIRDTTITEQLENAQKEGCDIVGVAGAIGFSYGNPEVPTGWWSTPYAKRGCMVHPSASDPSAPDMEIPTVYGPAPSNALVIDGAFIVLMNRGLELRFDTRFKFHGYDVDLCLQAYAKGMRTRVLPILCKHESTGLGFRSPDFMEAQKMMIAKWFTRN